MNPSPAIALVNPFPGLRPFREGEEHLFFGREGQVDRMVDKLAATRFLSIVGTSGSGKSSLVNCGLKPALHRGVMAKAGTLWCMVQLRPGGRPMVSMARAFAAEKTIFGDLRPEGMSLLQVVEATLNMSSLGLVDLYECAHFAPETNLLVVVDQFEELFRYAKGGDHAGGLSGVSGEAVAFVNLLLEAQAQTRFPIYVVLTMRSDFLGECAQFDRLPEVMNEGQYLVPRLARADRRAAIDGPICVAGASMSPVLLTRLVNDVGDNPDQLSILQHAINRTWAFWQHEGNGEGELALEHYENPKVGAMARALDLHAEETYAELKTEAEWKICEKVFKSLTDKGTDARGIRRPMPLKNLCAIAGASQEDVIAVLDVFREPSRSFLMPPLIEQLEPDTIIDISHEILMRVWMRLKSWADEEAESASVYRRLAETAELHGLRKAGLWGEPDLQAALEWKARQQPNAAWAALYRPGYGAAISFLEASKQVRDKELAEDEFGRRWRRVTPFLAAAVFAVFMVLSMKISPTIADSLTRHFNKGYDAADSKLDASVLEAAAPRDLLAPGTPKSFGNSHQVRRTTWYLVAEGLGYQIPAVTCLLGYLGLSVAGKKLYRRTAFENIANEIASRAVIPDKTPPAQDLPQELAQSEGAPAAMTESNPVPAGFWRILGAGLVDEIVYLLLAAICFLFDITVSPSGTSNLEVFILFTGLFMLACLYPSVMTWSRFGGTLGDRALGIRLTRLNGKPLSFLRIFARYGSSVISCVVMGLGYLGFLIQPFTPNKQALPDLIAGTRFVLRARKTKHAVEDGGAAFSILAH